MSDKENIINEEAMIKIINRLKLEIDSSYTDLLKKFSGGKKGQVLMKTSDDEMDFIWTDLPIAGAYNAGVLFFGRELVGDENHVYLSTVPREDSIMEEESD